MIDHQNKFIFIHIPKCGGISVENALGWEGARHNTMQYYKKQNPNIDLNHYYKFTFVRNPWDRLVSWYFYHVNHIDSRNVCWYRNFNFQEWCKRGFMTHWNTMKDGTCWKDKDVLDYQEWIPSQNQYNFIGKVENFQKDFDIICDRLGIPKKELPYHNKSNHKHYTEYYDDEARQIVAEKYAKDIEYFGYEFGK